MVALCLSVCFFWSFQNSYLFYPNILTAQDKSANFVCLQTLSAAALSLGSPLIWVRGKHVPSSWFWRCDLWEERTSLVALMGTGLRYLRRAACQATGSDRQNEDGSSDRKKSLQLKFQVGGNPMGFLIYFMEVKSLYFPRAFKFFGETELCASCCTTCILSDHTYISMFHLQQPSREGTDFKLWKKTDCSIHSNPHLKTINRSFGKIYSDTFLNFLEMSWIRAEYWRSRAKNWQYVAEK